MVKYVGVNSTIIINSYINFNHKTHVWIGTGGGYFYIISEQTILHLLQFLFSHVIYNIYLKIRKLRF